MSKPKKWPTVANRHRLEGIFLAGEIVKQTQTLDKLTVDLRRAIESNNITLALAIIAAIEGHIIATQEKAHRVIDTLESAPANKAKETNE